MSSSLSIPDEEIFEIKSIRVDLQAIIDRIEDLILQRPLYGAEATLAKRSVQTARHWLGESLAIIREVRPELLPHPYPSGDDPTTTVIDPTADHGKDRP